MHVTTQLASGATEAPGAVVHPVVGVSATLVYPVTCPRANSLVPCMMRPPTSPALRYLDITHALYGGYETTSGHDIQDAAVPNKYGKVAVDPF